MNRRRISFITPLCGRDGGVAAHVDESAAALRAAGHDVTIICERTECQGDRARVLVIRGLEDTDSPTRLSSLNAALQASEPDIVHIHDLADPRIVAATRVVAPTVITAHAYPGCSHNNHYFGPGEECDRAHGPICLANMAFRGCLHARNPLPIPGQYLRTTKRLSAYRWADAVAGLSEVIIRHLARNDIPAALVPPFTPALREAPFVASNPPVQRRVVFVGRIVPAKGLHVLLRAMVSVEGSLTVVGDGWKRAAAERFAVDLGIAGRVDFTGWLMGGDLHRAYRQASVVAVPSVWPEPFGLVGIEAMAFGRPVVASMTGGVSDWMQPGVTGLAVGPGSAAQLGQALERILDDVDLRRSMGAAARSAVSERFSEQAHVDALTTLYRAAAARWRGGRDAGVVAGHAD